MRPWISVRRCLAGLITLSVSLSGISWAGVQYMDYSTPGQNQLVVTTDSDSVLLSIQDPEGRRLDRDVKEIPEGVYRAARRKETLELVAVQILVPRVVYGKYTVTVAHAPDPKPGGTYNLTYYFMGERHDLVDNGPIPVEEPDTFALDLKNLPPVIISPFIGWAEVGETFEYKVVVEDPESDPVTFETVQLEEGMVFDTKKGVLTWIPTLDQLGNRDVAIAVIDAAGNRVEQAWSVDVQLAQPGNPEAVNRCDHVQVTWDMVPGAVKYRIQRTSPKQVEPFDVYVTEDSFPDREFVPDDTINYIVYAIDAEGRQGGQNSFAVVRTPADADGDGIMDDCLNDCSSRGILGQLVPSENTLQQADGLMRDVNLLLFPGMQTEASWRIAGVEVNHGSRSREPYLPRPGAVGEEASTVDFEVTGPLSLKLRAKREGRDGRTYHIRVEGRDCAGTYHFDASVQVPGVRPANVRELDRYFASSRQRIKTLQLRSRVVTHERGSSSESVMKLRYKAPGLLNADFNEDMGSLTVEGDVSSTTVKGPTPVKRIDSLRTLQPEKMYRRHRPKLTGAERLMGMLIGTVLNPSDEPYKISDLADGLYSVTTGSGSGHEARISSHERQLHVEQLVYRMGKGGKEHPVTVDYREFRTVEGIAFPGEVSIDASEVGWKLLIIHEDILANAPLEEAVFRKLIRRE
jgi:hypothetical protein